MWNNLPARFLRPMVRALEILMPPRKWRVPVILAAGVFTGLGAVAFHISNASSKPSAIPGCLRKVEPA